MNISPTRKCSIDDMACLIQGFQSKTKKKLYNINDTFRIIETDYINKYYI